MMGTSILAFVVVLGVLIFFHELGHFLVARLFGVGVEKFSLGFGPRIIGQTIGITDYRLSVIPLGGYVKMVGEEPDAEIDPQNIPISFMHKHVFKRILIVAAGPFFNLLLAAIIFFCFLLYFGISIPKPVIGEVKENTPAFEVGIKKGDYIKAINGEPIENWDEMAHRISTSKGKALSFTIERKGTEISLSVTPRLVPENQRYLIGVVAAGDVIHKNLGVLDAGKRSIQETYKYTELTLIGLIKLIQGELPLKESLGGPIKIAEMAGKNAQQGASQLFLFIAFLSINLAIINLLPIPVLDGGHLLFFFIEAVIGRPVNMRMREIAQGAGFLLLFALMIVVIILDISNLFSS
jgi:regulator of sigma E protease